MEFIKTSDLVANSISKDFGIYDLVIYHMVTETLETGRWDYNLYFKMFPEKNGYHRYQELKRFKIVAARLKENRKILNSVATLFDRTLWKDREKIAAAIYFGITDIPITVSRKPHDQLICDMSWLENKFNKNEIKDIAVARDELLSKLGLLQTENAPTTPAGAFPMNTNNTIQF